MAKKSPLVRIPTITISPILSLRYIQYDDPLYYWNPVPVECCDGISVSDVLLNGGGNTLYVLGIISIPYLIFFVPIGMFFSLKKLKKRSSKYITIWVLLILTTLPFVIANYALTNEARHMFHLYPTIYNNQICSFIIVIVSLFSTTLSNIRAKFIMCIFFI